MVLLSMAGLSAKKWKVHIGNSLHEPICGIVKKEGVALLPLENLKPTCIRCLALYGRQQLAINPPVAAVAAA